MSRSKYLLAFVYMMGGGFASAAALLVQTFGVERYKTMAHVTTLAFCSVLSTYSFYKLTQKETK